MEGAVNPSPVLAVEDLVVDYRRRHGGELRAVDHVDLRLRPGQVLGVVGESGSGKTTLGKVVAGFLKPTDGRVLVRGGDGQLQPRTLRRAHGHREVQMIFQESAAALNPRLPVWRLVGEALRPQQSLYRPLGKAPAGVFDEAGEMLELVGLPPETILMKRAGELSGGQKQRVAIARALAASPVAIVCDESVSALDVSVRAIVLNLFQRLSRERDVALLFITHDISVVAHLADEIVVMYQGKVVEHGQTGQIIDSPAADYTRRLIAAVPTLGRELT
ncbi:MAG TPA: ABC transporter ATP-binding protein [Solirubrobacteraceae bacterium]|jgi:ABC-type glutathione transport system ATPase component|nr:ABC transporter ATP-binding protein [Solirubrobacteraceae bacterium]